MNDKITPQARYGAEPIWRLVQWREPIVPGDDILAVSNAPVWLDVKHYDRACGLTPEQLAGQFKPNGTIVAVRRRIATRADTVAAVEAEAQIRRNDGTNPPNIPVQPIIEDMSQPWTLAQCQEAARKLCFAIEELPAGDKQTSVSIAASNLARKLAQMETNGEWISAEKQLPPPAAETDFKPL
jgi:hypothetical protein